MYKRKVRKLLKCTQLINGNALSYLNDLLPNGVDIITANRHDSRIRFARFCSYEKS